MRLAVCLASLLLLAACDRSGLEEPPEDAEVPGTFEASVRQLGGSGFETLSGTAVFRETSPGTLMVQLASPLPSGADTSTLHLIAVPGTAQLTEEPGTTALCYRSPVFQDGPYRAESGSVAVTTLTEASVEGSLDATAFLDLQTGPTTTTRIRVRIDGAFRARPGLPSLDESAIRTCDSP